MIRDFVSMYNRNFTTVVVYMLQSVEYDAGEYLRWLIRVDNFNRVIYRKKLVYTKPAKSLLLFIRTGIILQLIAGIILVQRAISNGDFWACLAGLIVVFAAPIIWAYLIVVPLYLGKWLIITPSNFIKVRKSKKIFANHPAVKIAVAGSYGKTTMKELLATVLAEGKKVAATPANKNVSISHARFAQKSAGDEEILIIEFGEGKPGDVKRFCRITMPNIAVITGLAPAHLNKYKTLDNAGKDIFSLADYVGSSKTFVNEDSVAVQKFTKKGNRLYSSRGLGDWVVKDLKSTINGLDFRLTNSKESIRIKSVLLGEHQTGPLAAVAVLARELGMDIIDIEKGIAKIKAFEHRMQPYQLSGAWIIDDTYNGNIDGVKAGLELLKNLPAKRRIYVTPGLVDQGNDVIRVHRQLGEYIKKSNPDQTVLMKHSVTPAIMEGLDGYKGQLIIEDDPLNFYTNLDKFVAAGDIVLLQNDWPDNYN